MTYETTPKQDQAIREWLQASIVPLIEQVLVKKLGQAMSFAAQEFGKPEREWVGLTEPELHEISPTWPAPGQHWNYEDVLAFARAVEAKLKEKNT